MTALEDAIARLGERLDSNGWRYMVIGGVANALWGVPRSTLDVDVTVWAEPERTDEIVAQLHPWFRPRASRPRAFAEETRVLPLETPEGVRADVIFGMLPFEEAAIARAVRREVAGRSIAFCTAEDLVLMKVLSDRPQDVADAEGIVRARGNELDLDYLVPRLEELAAQLERPEILERWRRWRR
jgi:hypothetical protein